MMAVQDELGVPGHALDSSRFAFVEQGCAGNGGDRTLFRRADVEYFHRIARINGSLQVAHRHLLDARGVGVVYLKGLSVRRIRHVDRDAVRATGGHGIEENSELSVVPRQDGFDVCGSARRDREVRLERGVD